MGDESWVNNNNNNNKIMEVWINDNNKWVLKVELIIIIIMRFLKSLD